MKKSILALLVLAVLCVYSCKKDNSKSTTTTTTTTTTVTQSMTAKIDGSDWSANVIGGSYLNGVTSFSGQAKDGQTITVTLTSKHGKGTYTLNKASNDAAAYSPDNSGSATAYTSNASDSAGIGGTVTITDFDSVNHTMSGTFSFTLVRGTDMAKKKITSGTFTKLAYTTSQATTTGAMTATINGNAWSAGSIFGIVNSGQLTVTGSSGSYMKTIGLSMPSNVQPGTYTIGQLGSTYYAQYNDNNTFMASVSGTLNITSNANHNIRGTFNFSAADLMGSNSATITNGSFKSSY